MVEVPSSNLGSPTKHFYWKISNLEADLIVGFFVSPAWKPLCALIVPKTCEKTVFRIVCYLAKLTSTSVPTTIWLFLFIHEYYLHPAFNPAPWGFTPESPLASKSGFWARCWIHCLKFQVSRTSGFTGAQEQLRAQTTRVWAHQQQFPYFHVLRNL